MADCLTAPPPGSEQSAGELYDNLRLWAERRAIEVHETDFGPHAEAAGLVDEEAAGLVSARGDRFVVVIDRRQSPDERLRTLAHELGHVLMEYGTTPPAHGVVHDVSGALEDRAYLVEALVDRAVGLSPGAGAARAELAEGARRLGLRPFVVACELARAAKGYAPAPAQAGLRDVRYY